MVLSGQAILKVQVWTTNPAYKVLPVKHVTRFQMVTCISNQSDERLIWRVWNVCEVKVMHLLKKFTALKIFWETLNTKNGDQ